MLLCGFDIDRDRTLLSLKNDKIKNITIQSILVGKIIHFDV